MFHAKPSAAAKTGAQPTIALGITGSIACYKAAYLCRQLREDGWQVRVLMTLAAQSFVGAATFRALSGAAVIGGDVFADDGMDHIHIARQSTLFLVAPASADFIAKAAAGFADNAVLAAFLAAGCPKMLAPAMNRQMWQAPPTQRNIQTLAADGVCIIGPASGEQACGDIGEGRMMEPDDIRESVRLSLHKPMRDMRVVISTGATAENIDTMRTISNRSSGRMGFAVAAACHLAGARVCVIAANTSVSPPPVLPAGSIVRATTNEQMHKALIKECADGDMFISAAAVADYTCGGGQKQKHPRSGKPLTLTLTPSADILADIGKRYPQLLRVGFAALDGDSDKWRAAAHKKMRAKNTSVMIANSVADADSESCQLAVYCADGEECQMPRQPKSDAARALAILLAGRLNVSRETSAAANNQKRKTGKAGAR